MVKGGAPDVDSARVSADDFFAAPSVSAAPFGAAPFAPVPLPARPATGGQFPLWPVLAGVVVTLGLIVGLAVVLWPHSSGTNRPDTGMARLFGQQTRTQLPQPVVAEDCAAAVRAFPAIARDAGARAAFIDGCLHP